jgi:hypothetical protein
VRLWTLLLLAAAGAAPAAGTAQDSASGRPTPIPAGLSCASDRISPDERRAFTQAVTALASHQDARFAPVLRAIEACAGELSWSPAKRRLAGIFTASVAGMVGLREELGGQGISFAEIDRAILSDRELMAAAAEDRLEDPAVGQAFALRHIEIIQRMLGTHGEDQGLGGRIGNYIAFRAIVETAAWRFGEAP